VVRLEGEIDIRSAAELKQILVEAMASATGFEMDVAGATEMDITALQLLWAAQQEAGKRGTGLTVAGSVPERISAIAREAGFAKFPLLSGAIQGQKNSQPRAATKARMTEGQHDG
jgi:anti-anti-sigma factor